MATFFDALPGETVGEYDSRNGYVTPESIRYQAEFSEQQRQADIVARQQEQAAKVERKRGKDYFGRAGIPTYEAGGTVQPVTDESGQPLTFFDQAHDVAYDSSGAPRQIVRQPGGNVELADPYAAAERRPDKE